MRTAALLPSILALVAGCCTQRSAGPTPAAALVPVPVLELPTHCNAAVTGPGGRVFVNFPHADGGVGVKVAEVTDGHTVVPYPDLEWNSYSPGKYDQNRDSNDKQALVEAGAGAHQFVGTNSMRVGPDGNLWVVDTGVTTPGGRPVPGGAKLVAIDTRTNKVVRIVWLDSVIRPDSFVDDVRFNGPHAYLTDAGHPAIIVLDLATGQGRRVLEDDASTTAHRPMRAVGHELVKFDGDPAMLNADQLEVSPDGRTFYFQPCPGPMVKIATKYLDDPAISPAELAAHVEPFYDTPTSGGTAIDGDGNIYLNDADQSRILKLTPAGQCSTVAADPRLHWGDAMWIDDAGSLWVPAAQQDRTATFNRGLSAVELPVRVYELPLRLKPLRN